MTNASAIGPVTLTIVGSPTVQDELSGTKEGTNIVFLHATVDGGEHLFQILCWTLKSHEEHHTAQLREITIVFYIAPRRLTPRGQNGSGSTR